MIAIAAQDEQKKATAKLVAMVKNSRDGGIEELPQNTAEAIEEQLLKCEQLYASQLNTLLGSFGFPISQFKQQGAVLQLTRLLSC